MASNSINNPWKGLNFYTEGEVLYGRNSEIQSLSQYIFNNTQTVLYGRSGIGKSSILNAGIFPKARVAGMIPVSIRLKHDEENNYLEQIRLSIETAGLIINEILPPINGIENETLWEFMHRHTFNNGDGDRRTPLLVFDQFEEIFTLQKKENVKREFFRQLGNLFNDVKPAYIVEHENQARQQQTSQQETKVVSSGAFKGLNLKLNIRRNDSEQEKVARYIERPDYHIVFAMREDFLSSLELYAASIPVMKDNRFGLLPINEEQAADIIRLPREGLVDNKVTKLIIQQVTGREDFELDGKPEIEVDAAVLSLFLSRLYIKKPEQENCITSELVNTYSGHIIHDFYVDSVTSNEDENENLSKDTILLLENLLLTREGRRNNVSRSDLIAQGVTEEELTILIEKRKLLRQFHHGNDIRIEYIHDILCPVVKERIEQRELLLKQEQERQRQEEEKRRLQKEAEERQREIEEKAAKEKARLEEEALKTKIRNRRIYVATVSFIFALVIGVTYYYFANIYTYKTYYSDFTRINGWPVGIGNPLNGDDRENTPIYYCLSHKGSSAPILRIFGIKSEQDVNTDVEILSSNSALPHSPRINSFEIAERESRDAKAIVYNELLSSISKIHFIGGENNVIEKEVALDEKDSTLFIVNYFHINNSDMWGSFVTPNGQAMQIREKEGIDRMKISTDSIGRIRSLTYYDQNGVCQPINAGVCGYAWDYDSKEGIEKRYLLNQFSLPIDNSYNLVITKISNDTLVTQYRQVSSTDDGIGVEALGPEGFCKISTYKEQSLMYISESSNNYSTKTTEKDSRGNVISEKIENNLSKFAPSLVKYTYNSQGELTKLEKLTDSGTPFYVNETDNYLYEWSYDEGKAVQEIRRNKSQITYQHIIDKKNSITKETTEDIYENKYIVKVDSIFKDGYSTSYFGRNNIPINQKVKIEEDSIVFHRKRCVLQGDKEYRYFYVYNDSEEKAPLKQDEYGKTLSYYSKIIKKDKDGNCISYKKLDENGVVIKSMMFFTLNGQIIGRAVEGIDNTPVRCNNWEEEGYLYYKIYYNKDFDDNFVGIQGMNEWGQSSVFNDPFSGNLSVSYKDFKGCQIELNPNKKIQIIRSYKQYVLDPANNISNYSYPYLHILDKESCLYKHGLRDGDRIVKLGNWSIGNSNKNLLDKEWAILANTDTPISIEVLRLQSNGTVRRFVKNISNTKNSKKLEEYHIMHLTIEELDYLKSKSIIK